MSISYLVPICTLVFRQLQSSKDALVCCSFSELCGRPAALGLSKASSMYVSFKMVVQILRLSSVAMEPLKPVDVTFTLELSTFCMAVPIFGVSLAKQTLEKR